jgi:hypothetical protein
MDGIIPLPSNRKVGGREGPTISYHLYWKSNKISDDILYMDVDVIDDTGLVDRSHKNKIKVLLSNQSGVYICVLSAPLRSRGRGIGAWMLYMMLDQIIIKYPSLADAPVRLHAWRESHKFFHRCGFSYVMDPGSSDDSFDIEMEAKLLSVLHCIPQVPILVGD